MGRIIRGTNALVLAAGAKSVEAIISLDDEVNFEPFITAVLINNSSSPNDVDLDVKTGSGSVIFVAAGETKIVTEKFYRNVELENLGSNELQIGAFKIEAESSRPD